MTGRVSDGITGRGTARRGRRRGGDVAFAVAASVALTAYNNLAGARPWHRRWYWVINAGATGAVLAAAAASGLTTEDLGLRPDRLGGQRHGGTAGRGGIGAQACLALDWLSGGASLLAERRAPSGR